MLPDRLFKRQACCTFDEPADQQVAYIRIAPPRSRVIAKPSAIQSLHHLAHGPRGLMIGNRRVVLGKLAIIREARFVTQ